MLRINVVTIFPEFFAGPLSISIPAKAMLLDRKLGAPVANECRTGAMQRQRR